MAASSAACVSFERERLDAYIERERFWRRQRRHIAIIAIWLIVLVGVPVAILDNLGCGHGCGDSARNQAYEIGKSITLFELQTGRLPLTLDELTSPARPHKPIMESIPRDAWGGEYLLVVPGVRGGAPFTIASAGADRLFFTADDVGNWQD